MTNRKLLRVGLVGSAVVAVCCFTPVLVLLLGVIGVSTVVGWLDYVLFPALIFFLGLTAFALWKKRASS